MKVIDSKGYFAGILYTTKKMIHEITNNSGSLAANNEYQVHWEGLTFRLSSDDNGFIDITVPTVVFNYPQEVSSTSISFGLKKVTAMRGALTPLIDVKEEEAISAFYSKVKELAFRYNLTVQTIRNPMSNIHRHPNTLSKFSGTDYDTDPTNPGIVFPFMSASMTPIYSSIILHREESELVHTEYRVANKEDQTLTYYKGKCVTYCKGYTNPVSSVYSMLYTEQTEVPSTTIGDTNKSQLLEDILCIFDDVDYSPDTNCVLADNLSKVKNNLEYKQPLASKPGTPLRHVGALPSLSTFIDDYRVKYYNKIFTIQKKQYEASDLYDFICEADAVIPECTYINTFDELFSLFKKEQMLDFMIDEYEEPYEEKEDTPIYNFKSKYPSPLYKTKD